MAEGKQKDRAPVTLSAGQLQVLSELVTRTSLARSLGIQQYGGDRDIYRALGYKDDLRYEDYLARYQRQDIAKAIIDRPVKATWQGKLEMIETNEKERTEFEKTWEDLDRRLGLKTRLSRVDRLTGIGQYGVLLLGLDDAKRREDFQRPVSKGKRELKYIKPFGEGSVKIDAFVETPSDYRYGQPEIYSVEVMDMATKKSQTVQVHHSRVIHITDDSLESEVYGTPRLEAVFNRLMDIEKIVGGDGEMFWRGARPGYQGKVDPDYQLTDEMRRRLKDELNEFEHDIRRFFINEGIDIQALAQQISDPANHVNVQLQMISAVTGIPQRILSGSERGELASSQDRSEWLSYIQSRREEHAEPRIVRPFINRLIELRILPEVKDGYVVGWADLFAQSEKARVEIGKDRSLALRDYTLNPMAEAIVPPAAFMQFFLGLTSDQIELINEMRDAEISEEKLAEIIAKGVEPSEGAEGEEREDALQPERVRTKPPGEPKKEKPV